GVFRLAFDPRKSSHYKVVQAGGEAGETRIQIYSSEIGNWSFYRDRFSYFSFDHFESAIYWNDVFHWLEGLNKELKQCKLNMKDHDHPIMTSLEIADGLHRGRNFLESFGGPINEPILLLMELPYMLHLEGKFFESCGCLLLVCRDDIGSAEFTIYEMMKWSSVWSVRYLVNIVQLLNPLPEGWSIQIGVWSICLGEREDDALVVINLSGKVVKYNLISNTNTEIFDIGSNQMDDDDDDDDDDADDDDDTSGTHKVIEKLSQEKVSQQEAREKFKWTVFRDHEIKVLGEVNVELESGSKKPREKLRQEEDTAEQAVKEFSSTLDNILEKLSQENESSNDFYGLMYDTDDDASISGKSYLFVGLDQPIQLVVSQNNVHEGIAEKVIKMANDQTKSLSSDKEVTDECLDDEQVGKSKPSKRIRVTKE
nr:hypothetical protein [Tanacetum cinerariifolium]